MINLVKKLIQILNEEFARYEQLRVNAGNEYQAMSFGAFKLRFLAKIKRSKADNSKKMAFILPILSLNMRE